MAWRTYEFDVNWLPVVARYREETVERVLVPLLARLARLRQEKGSRVVAFLAAPPATGKSTLCLLLEHLSRTRSGLVPVETAGIDGFHYPNAFLDTHDALVRGRMVRMREVKGCAETYDTARLASALGLLAAGGAVAWPAYSRETHDVAPAGSVLDGDVVVVEGNWLLLAVEPWRSMRRHADLTVLVRAEPELLHDRLVGRKVQGGFSRAAAEAWYEKSDGPNVLQALEDSVPGDVNLRLCEDGDLVLE